LIDHAFCRDCRHARNYLALEAVIADIRAQDVTDIVNLGDTESARPAWRKRSRRK
jgi:hypothetical protein